MSVFIINLVPRDVQIEVNRFMRGSRKLCQRGSNSENAFLVDEGMRDDQNITTSGPLSARQRMNVSLAGRC